MQKTIAKHKPIVQSELSGKENREKVITLFKNLGYKVCVLQDEQLIDADQNIISNSSKDFYFIPD